MPTRPGAEDGQLPYARSAALRAGATTAGLFARCGAVLISLTTGGALALAQYASLADGDPEPLERLAMVIAIGGVAVALLTWGWLAVAMFRQWRADLTPHSAATSLGCSYVVWLFLMVGGFVAMALGGDADTTAPLALAALGLGCAGAIGGFLGFLQVCWRWFNADLWRGREVRAAVRAAAAAQGREIPAIPRALTICCALIALVSAVGLVGCASLAPWLATAAHLPPLAALIGFVVVCMVICAPALSVFVYANTITYEDIHDASARAYSYRSSVVATIGLALLGILPALGLGFLAVVVVFGLVYAASKLRRRYLARA